MLLRKLVILCHIMLCMCSNDIYSSEHNPLQESHPTSPRSPAQHTPASAATLPSPHKNHDAPEDAIAYTIAILTKPKILTCHDLCRSTDLETLIPFNTAVTTINCSNRFILSSYRQSPHFYSYVYEFNLSSPKYEPSIFNTPSDARLGIIKKLRAYQDDICC